MVAQALVEPGRVYALYLMGGTLANTDLDLPASSPTFGT